VPMVTLGCKPLPALVPQPSSLPSTGRRSQAPPWSKQHEAWRGQPPCNPSPLMGARRRRAAAARERAQPRRQAAMGGGEPPPAAEGRSPGVRCSCGAAAGDVVPARAPRFLVNVAKLGLL
jgi:hypothetical protein